MAAIDGLLKLIAARGADELTLVAGEVPELTKGATRVKLSMPALDTAFFEQLFAEVAPDLQLGEGDAEEHVRYAIGGGRGGGGVFAIRLGRRGGALRLVAHPAAGLDTPQAPASIAPARSPQPAVAADSDAVPASTLDDVELERLRASFDELLREVERCDASDVLLSSGRRVRLRVHGELLELPTVFDEAEILALAALDEAALQTLQQRGNVDRSLDRRAVGGLRFRLNIFRQHHGVAAALRPIRREAQTLEQLGLPHDFVELVAHHHGMVLMAGPTGCGKSTTLAALIEHINATRAHHVITLEDPIEYEYASRRALIHQREVGRDVASFADGLRAALRESPDVILVGERRPVRSISGRADRQHALPIARPDARGDRRAAPARRRLREDARQPRHRRDDPRRQVPSDPQPAADRARAGHGRARPLLAPAPRGRRDHARDGDRAR